MTERSTARGGSAEGTSSLREELLAIAREVVDGERLERLSAQAGELGKAGDLVVTAHLDDLRLLGKARFHRARRDAGRELAVDSKSGATASAIRRVANAGGELALLRLQRDIAAGTITVPDETRPQPDQSTPQHDRQAEPGKRTTAKPRTRARKRPSSAS